MQKGLAVTVCAAGLSVLTSLALAAPLPVALPQIHAPQKVGAASAGDRSGIRPAVLEIAIPNSMRRVLAHPAGVQESTAPAAKTVQWLTGPVPSRCQSSAGAAPAAHACLVI